MLSDHQHIDCQPIKAAPPIRAKLSYALNAFDLKRFVVAQASVYDTVVRELEAGRKRTHWMWFIFPQLRALGRSETAQYFGIESLAEASAFLADPLLGSRLLACTTIVLEGNAASLRALFGSPDDLKFRSSMTLFAVAAGTPQCVFGQALLHYCNGAADERTLDLLKRTFP